MREGYAVIVTHRGEAILTIEREMLAGKSELSVEDADAIRDAAGHLLSFVGRDLTPGEARRATGDTSGISDAMRASSKGTATPAPPSH